MHKMGVGAGLLLCGISGSYSADYRPPVFADGTPDLEGTYTNASLTRLERPLEYGNRRVMTVQELAAVEKKNNDLIALGNQPTDPKATVKDLPADCSDGRGEDCNYNAAWTDPGKTVMRVHGEPRTSFITDPTTGRVPAFMAQATTAAPPGSVDLPPPEPHKINDNPETRALGERCLTSFGYSAGPVMLPLLYNNTYRIVQSQQTVAIEVEMVHDVRTIRLNVPHRRDGLRPWFGDSIGHYEGRTLVVETVNFPAQQPFFGSWKNLKVTERFRRVAADRVLYQFRVEDPTTWMQPWGGEYEFTDAHGRIFEYACHEGNYGLADILAGARAEEAAAASKTGSKPPASN